MNKIFVIFAILLMTVCSDISSEPVFDTVFSGSSAELHDLSMDIEDGVHEDGALFQKNHRTAMFGNLLIRFVALFTALFVIVLFQVRCRQWEIRGYFRLSLKHIIAFIKHQEHGDYFSVA